MTIPTLLISESKERTEKVETLIKSRSELALVGTVDRKSAIKQIGETKARLLWVELDPDPGSAVKMLTDIKKKYPKVPFLVSKNSLDAALTKTMYQLGALDFLDDGGMEAQVAVVIQQLQAQPLPDPDPPEAPPAPKPDAKGMKDALKGKKDPKKDAKKDPKKDAKLAKVSPAPAPVQMPAGGDMGKSSAHSLSRQVVLVDDKENKFPLWIISSLLTIVLVTATYFLLRNPAQ